MGKAEEKPPQLSVGVTVEPSVERLRFLLRDI